MSIKKYSFSEIHRKAERLRELWRKFPATALPKDDVLYEYDFAPLIGTICDEQINSSDAWSFPRWLYDRLRTFDLTSLLSVNYGKMLREYLKTRWPKGMKKDQRNRYLLKTSRTIKGALTFFKEEGKTPITLFENRSYKALEVYFTLRRVSGIGPKKASMITRDFIYRSLGILREHPWYDQIKTKMPAFKVIEGNLLDMPIDVHVVKVFNRIFGRFRPSNKGWYGELSDHIQDILAFSKLTFQDLPVKLDQILWHVGRTYCNEWKPNCEKCPISEICDSSMKQ